MQVARTAANRAAVDRSRCVVPGLLLTGSVLAFTSAALPWFELRPGFSADHRWLSVIVGVLLLVLAIRAASRTIPSWVVVVGAMSCVALGAFAIYDMATGHDRTFDSLV